MVMACFWVLSKRLVGLAWFGFCPQFQKRAQLWSTTKVPLAYPGLFFSWETSFSGSHNNASPLSPAGYFNQEGLGKTSRWPERSKLVTKTWELKPDLLWLSCLGGCPWTLSLDYELRVGWGPFLCLLCSKQKHEGVGCGWSKLA